MFTLACFAIGHYAIAIGTQTLVASWCVYTLMLAYVPLLTLIDIYTKSIQNRMMLT